MPAPHQVRDKLQQASRKAQHLYPVVYHFQWKSMLRRSGNLTTGDITDKRRPLKNAQFCSSSRKVKILTTPEEFASHSTGQAGIHGVFRGLKFEPDAEIEQKGVFCRGLKSTASAKIVPGWRNR
jgi:hypothetical protein